MHLDSTEVQSCTMVIFCFICRQDRAGTQVNTARQETARQPSAAPRPLRPLAVRRAEGADRAHERRGPKVLLARCGTRSLPSRKMAAPAEGRFRTRDVLLPGGPSDFGSLLLSPPVLAGLEAAGFHRPSPVQLKAIPLGRCGLGEWGAAQSRGRDGRSGAP